MKGVQNIYHHYYTFSFLLVFLVLILFHPALSTYVNTMSSSESLTISSNRTLVSPGGVFELGFFKPSGRSRWYLGIWYKRVSQKTYAWVANRDSPLTNSIGTFKISGNNLVLLGQSNNTVWLTNLTRCSARSPVIAELLPNGNFVMRYSSNKDSSGFLWQSFDFPTDTLLPEMKLGYDLKTGRNRFLTSWRSSDDPSSGNTTYKIDIRRGLPEFILNQGPYKMQRSGPWNGIEFSGIPEVQGLKYMVYNYTENSEEIAYTFHMTNQSLYSRLTISDYTLNRFTWIPPSRAWSLFWTIPTDACDLLYYCGSYSYCDLNTSPNCNCINGFVPKNRQRWDLRDGTDGCVRRTRLSCSGDGFLRLNNMNLPDTKTATVDRTIDVKKCEEKCLSDCNCTSFAIADVRNGGLGCVFWTGELVEMRIYAVGGQDLYVRLNDADLGERTMGQDYSYSQPSSSSEELDITSLIVAEGELYANEVESNNFTISQEYQYAAAPEADEGIPMTCYCGSEPVVKTSYTPKNPYRRYFSCNNVDDGECHIWKWWDVAMQEELRETQIQLRMLKDQFFESDQKVAKLEKILRVLSKKTEAAKYRFAKGVCLVLLLILVIVMWRKSLGGFKRQCLNSSWASKVQQQDM